MIRRTTLPLYLGIVVAACGEGDEPARALGIPEFRVSPDPTTVIGDGNGRYEFHRVVGIAVLADGSVVVADGSTQELRVFSPSGRFLRGLSRAGDGPGELRSMKGIGVRGDTIVVFESFPAPSRYHVFHPERGFLGRMRIDPARESRGVAPIEVVSSRGLLVHPGSGFSVTTAPPDGELRRDSIELGLWYADGSGSVRWLGRFPYFTAFSYELPDGRRTMGVYTLGPSLVHGASGGRVWIGDTGSGLIRIFDSSGTTVTQVEFPLPPRAFDEAVLEREHRAALARVGESDITGGRAWVEGLYDSDYRPAAAPRFARFIPGPAGEMWVESYSEEVAAPHTLVVLDSGGRHVGNATAPAGVTPHVVSEERLVGVQVDSLGVERVVMHEVER